MASSAGGQGAKERGRRVNHCTPTWFLVAVCLHRYCTPALTFNGQVSQSRWCTPSFAHVGPCPDSGSGLSHLGLCFTGQALYPRYRSPRCGKRALPCGAWLLIPTRALCGVPITAEGTSSPTHSWRSIQSARLTVGISSSRGLWSAPSVRNLEKASADLL